mmetsp:Transcript_54590/g.62741  ORF Transcript_54590/g.62741 Transcript_54590/m.62741 type:complete len:101 (-) Transcript_54590:64-366(-)
MQWSRNVVSAVRVSPTLLTVSFICIGGDWEPPLVLLMSSDEVEGNDSSGGATAAKRDHAYCKDPTSLIKLLQINSNGGSGGGADTLLCGVAMRRDASSRN